MASLPRHRRTFSRVGPSSAYELSPEIVPMTPQDSFNELCYYTLAHGDPSFIHQHVVDAFAAQNADEQTKPIKLTFALVGLYLYVEKGFSGKRVQRVHMALAQ